MNDDFFLSIQQLRYLAYYRKQEVYAFCIKKICHDVKYVYIDAFGYVEPIELLFKIKTTDKFFSVEDLTIKEYKLLNLCGYLKK